MTDYSQWWIAEMKNQTQLKVKRIAAIQLNRYQKPNQPYDWLFKPNKPKLSVSQLK